LTSLGAFDSFDRGLQKIKCDGRHIMKTRYLILFLSFLLLATSCSNLLVKGTGHKGSALFSVSRIVMAEGIENKEPVKISNTFSASTPGVYCFIEATNIIKDTKATFVWKHKGEEIVTFSLPLMQGPRWRTFAHKTLLGNSGKWSVEVKDALGNTIEKIAFTVK
jgi:hypothetical protein